MRACGKKVMIKLNTTVVKVGIFILVMLLEQLVKL